MNKYELCATEGSRLGLKASQIITADQIADAEIIIQARRLDFSIVAPRKVIHDSTLGNYVSIVPHDIEYPLVTPVTLVPVEWSPIRTLLL
jgi:hypothetical protein